jgi:hypothetical protein
MPAVALRRDPVSIALEVPDDLLGDGPIGVWASISLRRDGTLVQMDRGGHPTINPFINPGGEKNLYNSRQPADDVANYLGPPNPYPEVASDLPVGPGQAGGSRALAFVCRAGSCLAWERPSTRVRRCLPPETVLLLAWLLVLP